MHGLIYSYVLKPEQIQSLMILNVGLMSYQIEEQKWT